jgi:hypothetical protein
LAITRSYCWAKSGAASRVSDRAAKRMLPF